MTRYKNLEKQTTRHGKVAWYYRPERYIRQRVRGEYGSPEFDENYAKACAAQAARFNAQEENRKDLIAQCLVRKLKNARSRDLVKGSTPEITPEWARTQLEAQKYRCAVTGLRFSLAQRGNGRYPPFAPSLDRIDNRKGYEIGNVRIVLTAVNIMMLDWGDAIFDLVVKGYAKKHLHIEISPPPGQNAPHPADPKRLYRQMVGPGQVEGPASCCFNRGEVSIAIMTRATKAHPRPMAARTVSGPPLPPTENAKTKKPPKSICRGQDTKAKNLRAVLDPCMRWYPATAQATFGSRPKTTMKGDGLNEPIAPSAPIAIEMPPKSCLSFIVAPSLELPQPIELPRLL